MIVIPAPGEGKHGPEGHLGYLLRQASVAVLTMIIAYPGASGADLARLTFLTPQTINMVVRNLERDGAVEKSAHVRHGRILRLRRWLSSVAGTLR